MANNTPNTPKNNGAAPPSAPPVKAPSAPAKKAPASSAKGNKKLPIIIAIIAVLVIGAVVLAVVLKNAQDDGKLPEDTTKEFIFYATDENGIAVTDENGMAVTVIPETTVVALTTQRTEAVTDKNGEQVTDKNGEALTTVISEEVTNAKGDVVTTVIYQDVHVTVPVAVTDAKGEQVTDAKGEEVTEIATLPQNPNDQKPGGSIIMGTSSVVITDGVGNTAIDNNGNPYTSMVELTSNPDKVAPAAIDWKTSLGGTETDYFSSIASFKDGSYVAANITNSTNGDFAEFVDENGYQKYATPYTVLVGYDSKGNEDWRVAAGSLYGLHVVTDVIVAADGGFYAVGYGTNVGGDFVNGTPGRGYYDAFVYKYNAKGKEEWHKVFGTTTVDVFNAGALTSDGGIVVVGSVGDNDGDAAGFNKPTKQSAAVAVKYSADGKLVWKNVLGGNMDVFNDVCVSSDNSVYAVGNFASGTLFKNQGKTDGGVVKLSSTGKYISAMPVAGSNNELFSGITACKDGGVVVVGRSNSVDTDSTNSLFSGDKASKGGYDAYLVKLNKDLSIAFVKPFRGQNNDDLVDIIELEDGSFIATGSSNSSTRDFKGVTTRGGNDIVIASFDKYGNLVWVRSFGGTADESANAVCLSPKGGYVIAGRTLSKNIDMAGITQYVKGKSVGVIVKFPE